MRIIIRKVSAPDLERHSIVLFSFNGVKSSNDERTKTALISVRNFEGHT